MDSYNQLNLPNGSMWCFICPKMSAYLDIHLQTDRNIQTGTSILIISSHTCMWYHACKLGRAIIIFFVICLPTWIYVVWRVVCKCFECYLTNTVFSLQWPLCSCKSIGTFRPSAVRTAWFSWKAMLSYWDRFSLNPLYLRLPSLNLFVNKNGCSKFRRSSGRLGGVKA